MENNIEIFRLDSLIEEEIEFIVNNQNIIGFATYVPYKIEVGQVYSVDIDIFVNDSLEMDIQKNEQLKDVKYDTNFSYMLYGKLIEKDVLDVGFFITSELFEDYQYLLGKYVSLKVDRLDLSFN